MTQISTASKRTYHRREVHEFGPGLCHQCLAPAMRMMVNGNMTIGDWDEQRNGWRLHECPRKQTPTGEQTC